MIWSVICVKGLNGALLKVKVTVMIVGLKQKWMWLSVLCLLNCSAFFFFFCSQTWYRCMCIISSHITPPLPHPLPQTSPPKEKDKTKATTRTTKCSVKLHSLIQNHIQLECTGSALKQWVMLHLFRSILWWLQSPDQWGFYLFVCLCFGFHFVYFFPLKYCVMTDL